MSASRGIKSFALDVLLEWLPGYTCPEKGPQQRIRVLEYDSASVTISAEAMNPFASNEKRFRIEVQVTEVE